MSASNENQNEISQPPTTQTIIVNGETERASVQPGREIPLVWTIEESQPQTVSIEISFDGGETWEIVESNVDNSGTYTFSAPSTKNVQFRARVSTSSDEAENGGSPVVLAETPDVTTDGTDPTGSITIDLTTTIINQQSEGAFGLTGLCNEPGSTLSLENNSSVLGRATCLENNTFEMTADTRSLNDGSTQVSFVVTDPAGNSTTSSLTLTKDTSPPSVATTTGVTNGGNYSSGSLPTNLSGTCSEEGSDVAITGAFTATVTCTGGAWSASIDMTGLSTGSYTYSISQTDSVSNVTTEEIAFTLSIDNTAPTGTLILHGGAPYTTSLTINASLSTDDATQMRISNSSDCTGGTLESFSTTKTGWTLASANQVNTVSAALIDAAGNESCVLDTVEHDDTAPTAPSGVNLSTTTAGLTVSPLITFTAGADSGSGVSHHQVQIHAASDDSVVSGWQTFTSGSSISGLNLTASASYYASLRAVDTAGNTGATVDSSNWQALNGWQIVAHLNETGSGDRDNMGKNIDFFGDRVVAGAHQYHGTAGDNSGAAYVFQKSNGSWSREQMLLPSDPGAGDRFGNAIAFNGTSIAVGAPNHNSDAGAVYIFEQDNSGTWVQTQKLTSPRGGSFGNSIAMSGDKLAVAARYDDLNGTDRGTVSFYRYQSGSWVQTQTIQGGDTANRDHFGDVVALSGNLLVVRTWEYNGKVYVFRDDGTTLTEEDILVESDTPHADGFGRALATDGTRIVVGAELTDDAGKNSGSVHIFEESSGVWAESHRLTAPSASGGDLFGFSVALDGNRLVVGAEQENAFGSSSGQVYVYNYDSSSDSWGTPDTLGQGDFLSSNDRFGTSVKVIGNTIAVGVRLDNTPSLNMGAVMIFDLFE